MPREDKAQQKYAQYTTSHGVTAQMDNDLPERDSISDLDQASLSNTPGKSLRKIKEDVQTIIDIMGPHTPDLSTNSEADHEESIYSNTKCSWQGKGTLIIGPCSQTCSNPTDSTTAPDISIREDTAMSMEVDKSTTTCCYSDDNTTFPYTLDQRICPPPLLPANVCVNSECMCPLIASYLHRTVNNVAPTENVDAGKICKEKNSLIHWIKNIAWNYKGKNNNSLGPGKCEFYKMNIKRSTADVKSPPKRLIFELVDNVPITENCFIGAQSVTDVCKDENAKKPRKEKPEFQEPILRKPETPNILDDFRKDKVSRVGEKSEYLDSDNKTRVDFYYFDHGNSTYFRTTDNAPLIACEYFAEKTEALTTRFWAELFGTIHIGISFCTSFILQFFRFILYSLLRPLTVGLIQLASDYFFKPFLSTCFNGFIQPPLIFVYNVATSLRDLMEPLAEGLGYFLREAAVLIGAFRIVAVSQEKTADEKACRGVNKKSDRKDRV